MELKKMETVAIKVKGVPTLAYTIQEANDTYKLPQSFGVYAQRGYFTTVAQDGKSIKHFLLKDKFDIEILSFELDGNASKKHGRPALEDRIVALHAKIDRLTSLIDRIASELGVSAPLR